MQGTNFRNGSPMQKDKKHENPRQHKKLPTLETCLKMINSTEDLEKSSKDLV